MKSALQIDRSTRVFRAYEVYAGNVGQALDESHLLALLGTSGCLNPRFLNGCMFSLPVKDTCSLR